MHLLSAMQFLKLLNQIGYCHLHFSFQIEFHAVLIFITATAKTQLYKKYGIIKRAVARMISC